jgi:molybdopterin-guanine dinucleotide biosynthesis protein B
MPAKAVAVTGFKNSGKTRVVEALTAELTRRGYKVGTIKHTADDIALDTPGKDTSRHREAGSQATVILQQNAAAIFLDQHLTIQEAAQKLGPLDYLIIEGFKTLNTHPRILVPRDNTEIDKLRNDLEIAIVNLPESRFHMNTEIPQIELIQIEELADIVENNAFPLLPGLDCHSCGYLDCKSMGAALLAGEAKITQCIGYGSLFKLRINDTDVPLNNFTRAAMQNVILGFIKTLKGGEEARKVSLEFEQE